MIDYDAPDPADLEDAPTYSLKAILREVGVYQTIIERDLKYGLRFFRGRVFDDILNVFFNEITEKDPIKEGDTSCEALEIQDALRKALKPYRGKELNRKIIEDISHCFIQNRESISMHSRALIPWEPGEAPIWAVIQVVGIERLITKNVRYRLYYKAYNGTLVNREWFCDYWPDSVRKIMRLAGCPKYPEDPLKPTDVQGMWLLAKIFYNKKEYQMSLPTSTDSIKKYNKDLYKGRIGKCVYRRPGVTKGGKYIQGKPYYRKCFNCPVGKSNCELSRHEDDFRKYPLEECSNYLWSEDNVKTVHKGLIVDEANNICWGCLNAQPFNKDILNNK